MDELAVYKEYIDLIQNELQSFLTRFPGPSDYYDFLLYHFGFKKLDRVSMNGALRHLGKRLRPVMSLLIYRAITGQTKPVLPLVLSAEIMHNASLIHDDIQDHDEIRWGRPTVWKVAGLEQGINFGDTLQAMAYGLILDLGKTGTDSEMITKIIAASNRVHIAAVEGQFMDLQFEKQLDISETEYFEMIGKKTATPFAGIAECSSLLATGGKNPELVAAYKNFAYKFGMLFQLTDDILGIWGNLEKTGKLPADIQNNKKTLPIIYALAQAGTPDKQRLSRLYSNGKKGKNEAEEVVRILESSGAKELCHKWAGKFYAETIAALAETSITNGEQEKLKYMADYCYQRSQLTPIPA